MQQGWMHIHGVFQRHVVIFIDLSTCVDSRNIPALGRIGDPDDIIASVLVQDSKVRSYVTTVYKSTLNVLYVLDKILPDTYQAMPSYRFCTADGPTQLTEGLERKLKNVLESIASRESQ